MGSEHIKRGSSRPGGRTEVVRAAVAEAVLELLKQGNANFSMAEVAELAGIHRSTLYRRWQTQADLIQEAMTLHAAKVIIPDTGNWKKDLRALINTLTKFVEDPIEMAIVRAIIDPKNENLATQITEHWAPLMVQQASPIHKAIARGEIRKNIDPQMLFSLILSPLLLQSLVMGSGISNTYKKQLEAHILQLCV